MNYFEDSSSTKKNADSGYSIHDESISSNDYETNSESSGSFSFNDDHIEECKQLASVIVNNLISRAVAKVAEIAAIEEETSLQESNISTPVSNNDFQQQQKLSYLPPAIQIDLVGSKTPSPDTDNECSECTWSKSNQINYIDEKDDYDDVGGSNNDLGLQCSNNDYQENTKEQTKNPPVRQYSTICQCSNIEDDEIREFAKEYVKNIIKTAIEMSAVTRSSTIASLRDELCRRGHSPWYLRLRQVLTRLMRSTCLCKAKQFRQRKT